MGHNQKVGILGGTFNPIHNGHIQIAKKAKELLALDYVLFIPSGTSYMKQHVLDANIRYEMTKLAIKDIQGFLISDLEVKRAGNSYTWETLTLLKELNPDTEYYFIMGADSLFSIEHWKEPDIICKLATLVCTVRDHVSIDELTCQAKHLYQLLHAKVEILPISNIDISSTQIREDVINKKDISTFVPEKVADYIRENHLYQN